MARLTRIKTCAVVGIEAMPVDVETKTRMESNHPRFVIIGLGDNAVKESRERVSSAIRQAGFRMPQWVLVNLSPAELRKEGSSFDVAIALGILASSEQIPESLLSDRAFFGELALDGQLRPVRGMIALAIAALNRGCHEIGVPSANIREARLLNEIDSFGVKSLTALIAHLRGDRVAEYVTPPTKISDAETTGFDHVWGQHTAKRALTIAAAGGHNILMIGPPGCGKSMLAGCFQHIIPPLTDEEKLDVMKIHSVAGLPVEGYLSGRPPFRTPHHIVSDAGLIGGGSIPRPGEVSLAHNGVLFLDEFPEYRRTAIESLRLPLESGEITVSRVRGSIRFPARFILLAAMNPCPCGRLGSEGKACMCSRTAIQGYLKKLSQPILDRIDLHVELESVPIGQVVQGVESMPHTSTNVREEVIAVRELQRELRGTLNAYLPVQDLKRHSRITPQAMKLLERSSQAGNLSVRGYLKVIRVARTIADMKHDDDVDLEHISEALGFRALERIASYCSNAA